MGQEGGVFTTDADEGLRLEIPPDTFSQTANISIKVNINIFFKVWVLYLVNKAVNLLWFCKVKV